MTRVIVVVRDHLVFQDYLGIQDLRVRKVIVDWLDQEVYKEQEVIQ